MFPFVSRVLIKSRDPPSTFPRPVLRYYYYIILLFNQQKNLLQERKFHFQELCMSARLLNYASYLLFLVSSAQFTSFFLFPLREIFFLWQHFYYFLRKKHTADVRAEQNCITLPKQGHYRKTTFRPENFITVNNTNGIFEESVSHMYFITLIRGLVVQLFIEPIFDSINDSIFQFSLQLITSQSKYITVIKYDLIELDFETLFHTR